MSEEMEKKPSVAKKLFKAVAYALMAAVYLILFIRFFVSCDSSVMKEIVKTPAIEEAYAREKDSFEIRQYEIRDWYKSIDDGKLLSVDNLYYIPETHNLQVSVKFNKKILPEPDAAYSAENLPFSFYLEDETLAVYTDYSALYDQRFSFGYIRLNFENIDLEKAGGVLDENGNPETHQYELYLKMRNADGEYEAFQSFSLYTGSRNFKRIYYK